MTVEAKAFTPGTNFSTSANAGPSSPTAAGALVAGTSAIAYSVVTVITDPEFVADTPDMAFSAVGKVIGQNCSYFEPGHLLWRPTGAVMLETFGTVRPGEPTKTAFRASEVQLGWFAWFSGLVTIVTCAIWLQRKIGNLTATLFGVSVVLLSKAFINYAQVARRTCRRWLA